MLASCRAGSEMAGLVVERIRNLGMQSGTEDDLLYLKNVDGQFSDSETVARLEQDVSGTDVYLLQALLDPASGQSVDYNSWHF